MTDDFTHSLVFDCWEYDEWKDQDIARVCDDPDCIMPDPFHSPGECFTVEQAKAYYKEGMRTSDEYKFALSEVLIKAMEIEQRPVREDAGYRKITRLIMWLQSRMEESK